MEFDCEFAIGLFDCFGLCAAIQTEDFVVVAFRHGGSGIEDGG
jgi:hypothetical protein